MIISQRAVYISYLIISLPTTVMAWYYGFPRGYYFAFVGISFTVLILHFLKDELVEDRAVWKEYFIGCTGIAWMILHAILTNRGVYATTTDLYYMLIGITVFELGILPFYFLMDRDVNKGGDGWLTTLGIVLAMVGIFIASYILFAIMDVGVVH